MTEETFRTRLEKHRAVGYVYQSGDQDGLINISFHEDIYVLTWEECKHGDQANEDNYTRDDRFEFHSVDEVVDYLQNAGVEVERFTP